MREIKFRAWDKKTRRMLSPEYTETAMALMGWSGGEDGDYIYMQYTGLCYEGDYVVMDCWNGGDGINEPSIHAIFKGVVIYDKRICRFGLQTKKCDEGQIEVGLEDNKYTEIEVIGDIYTNPDLLETKNEKESQENR